MSVLNIAGSRSMVAGVVVSAASVVVPVVFGDSAESAKVDLLDGAAWLSSESAGNVVRVNGQTGRVDARLELGEIAGEMLVEQARGIAVVKVGNELRSIDLANLEWSAATADGGGGLVVGDGAAYMVGLDGKVRELDPSTLETVAEVDLQAVPGPGVVADGRLVLPLDDGTVRVVDGDEVTAEVEAGEPGDTVHVSRVGDGVAVLNQSQQAVQQLDAGSGRTGEASEVELPSGELLVPRELPSGRLWAAAVRSGELTGISLRTGRTVTAPVAEGRHDLTPPVVAGGHVYLVDRTAAEVVEVDAETLEVLRREPLGVDDASRVELMVEGGKVFVNDRASSLAIVIDGDRYTRVDKYSDQGVASDTPVSDVSDLGPAPSGGPAPAPAPADSGPPPPPAGPPSAPVAVAATPGNGSATVSWSHGGGPNAPTGYHVTAEGLGRQIDVPGGQLAVAVDGLSNGDTYTFEVWASNEHGESERVAADPVVPNNETPGAPSRVRAADGDASATVTWDAADGRGNDITGYIVTPSPADAPVVRVDGDATEAEVPRLTNGTAYTFTVTAVNDLDVQSDPSEPSNEVTPWGPPGEIPSPLIVTPGSETVSLAWEPAPSHDGQVSYRIAVSPAAGGENEATTEDTSYTFEGLENGTTYTFTVVPENERGAGPAKTAQISPGGEPSPGELAVQRTGDRRFRVTFDVDDGGRPIDSCTVDLNPGGSEDCEVSGSSGSVDVTIDVPDYNTRYTFTPEVTNEFGTSEGGPSSATSNTKPLVVDATSEDRWDGACTWFDGQPRTRPYYTEPNHTCPRESPGPAGYIDDRATVRARCWTTGGEAGDDYQLDDPSRRSNRWVRVEQGYMNTMYFSNWDSNPESNLPRC